jgi:hypothetical protein
MSTMTVAVTFDLLSEAFDKVDVTKRAAPAAPGGAAKAYSRAPEVEAAVNDAWIRIKSMVERCVNQGKAIIQSEVSAFMQYVDSTSKELGARAKEFRDRLLDGIREMITKTFDLMLKALRSDIVVGQRTFALKTLDLEQKLLFSGSLQISLTSLCELAGSGELTVTGSYEVVT